MSVYKRSKEYRHSVQEAYKTGKKIETKYRENDWHYSGLKIKFMWKNPHWDYRISPEEMETFVNA